MKLFKNALLFIIVLFSVSTASASTQIDLNNQLMRAVANGQIEEVVEIVLLEAVDFDAINRAFIFSAENGHTEIVAFFILYTEVDVDVRDIFYQTALIRAAAKGYIDTVNFLIAAGADVNPRDCNGTTALVHAAQEGHAEVVKVLITAGADVSIKTNSGRTALYFAEQFGYTDVANVIKDHLKNSSKSL